MEKILTKKSFPEWVKKLKSFRIIAPVKDKDFWSFEIINNPDDMDLNFLNTVLAPKKIIFPQREAFFEFGSKNESGYEVKEILPEEDLAAQLDSVKTITPSTLKETAVEMEKAIEQLLNGA